MCFQNARQNATFINRNRPEGAHKVAACPHLLLYTQTNAVESELAIQHLVKKKEKKSKIPVKLFLGLSQNSHKPQSIY